MFYNAHKNKIIYFILEGSKLIPPKKNPDFKFDFKKEELLTYDTSYLNELTLDLCKVLSNNQLKSITYLEEYNLFNWYKEKLDLNPDLNKKDHKRLNEPDERSKNRCIVS